MDQPVSQALSVLEQQFLFVHHTSYWYISSATSWIVHRLWLRCWEDSLEAEIEYSAVTPAACCPASTFLKSTIMSTATSPTGFDLLLPTDLRGNYCQRSVMPTITGTLGSLRHEVQLTQYMWAKVDNYNLINNVTITVTTPCQQSQCQPSTHTITLNQV